MAASSSLTGLFPNNHPGQANQIKDPKVGLMGEWFVSNVQVYLITCFIVKYW
jgi:hypothetical protein